MNLSGMKKKLEIENKHLNDNIMKIRLEAEDQLREMSIRIQEDEYRKYMGNLKMIESKAKMSEESRETLARKNQELVRQIQDKERLIHDEFLFLYLN